MNKCVVCGKLFEPVFKHPKQKTCSPECRLIVCRQETKAWRLKHPEKANKPYDRDKYYNYIRKPVLCRICGKPTEVHVTAGGRRSSDWMHDECIINECKKKILNSEPLGSKWVQRLYTRGYTARELKEEIAIERLMSLDKEKNNE